jgi:signal transduction histidine kinase
MLCEHEGFPPDVVAQLRVVQRNALRLQALLSDLLHVGQVGEDSLQLQRTPVDLADLVDEAVEATRPFAEKCGVAVEVEAPDHLCALVDEQRIRQVLDNLLSNAVKYSEAGGSVTVVVQQGADAIELGVTDTGIGIAQDEVEQVFGRFFRGGGALEKHIPGTGLGLNIVSTIVAAHDGAVTLESEAGRGTTFRVTLPNSAV